MKHSGIILFFIIISTFCFFNTYMSSPFRASHITNNLHVRFPRRALLSTHLTQQESGSNKVLDAAKHLPNQEAYNTKEPLNNGSNDAEEELIYHIDYHGVTTHPGPNPKHGRP